VITPQYDKATAFYNGKAAVSKDHKWFMIDKAGKQSITPDWDYTFLGKLSENRIRVRSGEAYSDKIIQWGYIDSTGNKMISSEFKNAEDFHDGLARVRKSDLWGYIRSNGDYFITPQFEDARDFISGLARVQVKGKYGIIDTNGAWVVEPIYDHMWDFEDGFAAAEFKGKWGIIDQKGSWVVAPTYKYIKKVMSVNCEK
jgi:hypothetical protein